MNPTEFAELIQRYRNGACTDEEKNLLENWYNSRLQQPYLSLSETEEALIGESIKNRIDRELESIDRPNNTVPMWRRPAIWWVAAASLLAMVTVTYLALRNQVKTKVVAVTGKQAAPAAMPGGNKALLTLADGTVIVLDSAANGQITTQGATMIVKKQDGQLVYDATGNKPVDGHTTWNTISTPRGGQYQVVLPDGSKVWLNAASSLRFPAGFEGNERRVELSGEAYFEVEKGKMPFIVKLISGANSEAGEVKVMGTHFNINNYADEGSIKTTLLEGMVQVVSHGSAVLKPGQQAVLTQDARLTVHEDVDVEEAIAWKNGLFQFNDADVQTVMRQITRWYDVEVEYQGSMPTEKFVGEIPRSSAITEVLKMLELSNVHYKIEGKKITVLP